jgi:subtilisin family serine protease
MPPITRRVAATILITAAASVAIHGRSLITSDDVFALSGEPLPGASTTLRTQSTALDRIGKRQPALDSTTWRAGTGRGITIYIFDGGITTGHPELDGRVRAGYNAFPENPRACNSHGAAVAGAAAGATLGVAPEANVVDVKIIDCARMRGSSGAILAAAQWTAADHALHPDQPAVANWSFVVDTVRSVAEVDSAVAILERAGILVVAAAGNFDMNACHASPANAPGTLVVGASAVVQTTDGRWRDVRVPNTAWGECVDLFAPGRSVLLPAFNGRQPITAKWSGTSMAAGFVSGAAALILERNPTANPKQVMDAILRQATPAVADTRLGIRTHAPLLYIGPTVLYSGCGMQNVGRATSRGGCL